MARSRTTLFSFLLAFAGTAGAPTASLPAQHAAAPAPATALCGRLETHDGIRVLHTWGTPDQRGYAHGRLLAQDIATAIGTEFGARFGRTQPMLTMARQLLPRLIDYPAEVRAEIEGVWRGVVDAGVDRDVPALDRAWDLDDLLLANALDVFGLMGCSGFTVFGPQVEGGGVLTARNFDWPFTGPHLIDETLVLVQHTADGPAVASVTWPGYVGAVTGVSELGVAVFLHVGTGKITRTPEPGSWPTATAARAILEQLRPDDPAAALARAQELVEWTSPPMGFLTRVVLPTVPPNGSPAAVFEADSEKVVRAALDGVCIVTNHFQGRDDGRSASGDSLDRLAAIRHDLDGCLGGGDRRVSIDEAWQALRTVQRGGGHAFGTLHSLVFRHDPWCFELRLGQVRDGKLVAAPDSERRASLPREALFPKDLFPKERPVPAGAGAPADAPTKAR
ncbi:MAG: C45 family autoproteolytic acyltransferase/hydrolase [Planctomycetota bacterium]